MATIQQNSLSITNVAALGCMGFGAYADLDNVLADIALLKTQRYHTIELFEIAAFFDGFGYDGLESILNATQEGWLYPEFSIPSGFIDCMYILGLSVFDRLIGII